MSKSLLHQLNKLLRPCLINLVGIHKLRDSHNDFKCKILVDESSSSNNQVTEIQNENPLSHKRRWIQHYDKIYDNLSSIDTTNYDGIFEFDENFTLSQDFQRKLLTLLNEELKIHESDLDYSSDLSSSSRDCSDESSSHPEDCSEYPNESLNSWKDFPNILKRAPSVNGAYLSFAVSINGKMILKKAYRYQDRENLVPAKEDMVGEIGSITKTLTALMIMKLIEEEEEALSESEPPGKRRRILENRRVPKITLDSYVEDILTPDVWPEHFVRGETDGKRHKVTIKQLLQHTAGLKSNKIDTNNEDEDETMFDSIINDNQGNLINSVRQIQVKDLASKPGEYFIYSNYGYQLLALVYEKRTGRSFVEDLRDELAKMGLYDTDFNYREYLALDRARGFIRENSGILKVYFVDMSWHEADYGLVSTVSDVVKYGNIFASCLLNKSNLHTSPLSTNQATEMWMKHHHVVSEADRTWSRWMKEYYQGLGWQVKYVAPLDLKSTIEGAFILEFLVEIFEHGGSTEQNESQLCIFKESGCKTQSHKVLQKMPLMYPLGEDFESEQDIVVGGIIIERLENQAADDLLSKIMNLVRYEYLRDT